jgi:putative photosynthetic complex assembly protein
MQTQHPATPNSTAIPMTVRVVLFGLALLLLGIYAARQAGLEVRQPDAPVVWKKDLRFADGEHGEILVFDTTSQKIASFEGEQGFLRGTLRALARERKKRSISPEVAFELSGHADGQMVLRDPATGESIHLASFGPSNAMVYRQLQ